MISGNIVPYLLRRYVFAGHQSLQIEHTRYTEQGSIKEVLVLLGICVNLFSWSAQPPFHL